MIKLTEHFILTAIPENICLEHFLHSDVLIYPKRDALKIPVFGVSSIFFFLFPLLGDDSEDRHTILKYFILGDLGAARFIKLSTQKFLSPADMFFAICKQLKSIHYVKILIHNQKLKATLNMHRKEILSSSSCLPEKQFSHNQTPHT